MKTVPESQTKRKSMIGETDFQTVITVDGDPTYAMVLIGDHARRALPAAHGTLGLPAHEFERHIAYDIGVEGVIRCLARRLNAPAAMAGFSRLLIDPNRGEDDPTLIRQLYDGTVVPGNYPMSAGELEERLERYYRPYRAGVAELIADVERASGRAPFIVSIHSFTPQMQGVKRPWQVGVLWDRDPRGPQPLLEALRADLSLVVGDNEPYDGALRGDMMFTYAIRPGFAHVLIEIRQDLIADAGGQEEWAARLAPILDAINQRDDMHESVQYGSRTGPVT